MLFPSLAFIFIFLPLLILLYFINRSSLYRNILLLLASLFFYAWGEPVFVILLASMILINWQAALRIQKNREKKIPPVH